MAIGRSLGALGMLAALLVSLGTRAATHAHGHCLAVSERASGPSASDAAASLSVGPVIARSAHTAHTAHTAHGAIGHHAPGTPSARLAPADLGSALGPMAECAHCTGGHCEMITGCGAAGAPFAQLAAPSPRGPADLAARGVHGRPVTWRSTALDPPTPPPNRFG